MDTQTPPIKPYADSAKKLVDQAADATTGAIHSTQNVANAAFDRMSDQLDDARNVAAPAVQRIVQQAESAARRGIDAVRESSAQLRERAVNASDSTVGYIKDEPVKSVLIAAATGAALMALVALLSRSRHAG